MAAVTVAPEVLDKLFNDDVERYELVDGELLAKPMVSIFRSLYYYGLVARFTASITRQREILGAG